MCSRRQQPGPVQNERQKRAANRPGICLVTDYRIADKTGFRCGCPNDRFQTDSLFFSGDGCFQQSIEIIFGEFLLPWFVSASFKLNKIR